MAEANMFPPKECPKTIMRFSLSAAVLGFGSFNVSSTARRADKTDGAMASLTGFLSKSVNAARALPTQGPTRGTYRWSQFSSVRAPRHPTYTPVTRAGLFLSARKRAA